MTPELKPCPFCNGNGDFCETEMWWVRCDDCGVEAEHGPTREDAVKLWNRRAIAVTPPDIDRLMQRLTVMTNIIALRTEFKWEEVGALIHEIADALASERAAHAETKRERDEALMALEPFAAVAEHDIGDDETDDDIFWPISNARYSMSGRLRVGHLRAARRVREGGEANG